MAQITAVPAPILAPRQIDLTSLLSAGLAVITSILTDAEGDPTGTAIITAPSATETSEPIITLSPTSRRPSSRTTPTSRTTQTTSLTSSETSSFSSSTVSSRTISAASSTSSPVASSSGSNKNTLAIVLGVVLGVVCLLLLALVACLCIRRRRKYGSFFRKNDESPGIDSDGESYIGAGSTMPAPTAAMKETSASSSEPSTSLSHSTGVSAPVAAAMAPHYRDQEMHYPPIPAAHQISSLGRRSSDYAYPPNDPFEDRQHAQTNFNREQQRERERRLRLSLTLDPVREYPMRERSTSETRYPPPRRWTAGPGMHGMPPSPQDPQRRRIPRKPVPSMSMSPTQHSDTSFEQRRYNVRGWDNGDIGIGLGTDNGSRYPQSGPRPGNPNRRYYASSTGSF